MKIKLFEQCGLDRIEDFLTKNSYSELFMNEKTLRSILKQSSIFFSLENCNRLVSTLFCELGLSYVQQSQRYVSMSSAGSSLVAEVSLKYEKEVNKLIKKAFGLYKKMSELKEGVKTKGRPKLENYKYGIPIEDARYILPLVCNTNMVVTLTGDKLLDIYQIVHEHFPILKDLKRKLFKELIPENILRYLENFAHKNSHTYIEKLFYEDYFDKINEKNNLILFDRFKKPIINVGLGAVTSTKPVPASEIYKKWGTEAVRKSESITRRVVNYGHEGIIEHSRTTFGMMMSLVAYHQFIRHRLSNNARERFSNLLLDIDRKVAIPPTIQNSIFIDEYLKLTKEFKKLRREIFCDDKKNAYGAYNLLLNCDQIKVVANSNTRVDSDIMKERICLNAQWEIRNLYIKKLKILRNISNVLHERILPSCMRSGCKEGNLSCGKPEEIKRIIEKI